MNEDHQLCYIDIMGMPVFMYVMKLECTEEKHSGLVKHSECYNPIMFDN